MTVSLGLGEGVCITYITVVMNQMQKLLTIFPFIFLLSWKWICNPDDHTYFALYFVFYLACDIKCHNEFDSCYRFTLWTATLAIIKVQARLEEIKIIYTSLILNCSPIITQLYVIVWYIM